MKKIHKIVFVICLFFLIKGMNAYASGAQLPEIVKSQAQTLSKTDADNQRTDLQSLETEPTKNGPYLNQVKAIVEGSACSGTNWIERGKAPIGFIQGISLSYARSLCRLKSQSTLSLIMSAANSGNTLKDALAYNQSIFTNLPIPINIHGAGPLRAVYVLGIGLGMRESSGSYCEGWDRSAGSDRPSSSIEAGLFQMSYDSIASSNELKKLYSEYKSGTKSCYQDIFQQGVQCKQTQIMGSGAGAEFQAWTLKCPAFATEYAMVMLRIQRGHFGPINRKEAQITQACNQLLISVEHLINNDLYACQDFI